MATSDRSDAVEREIRIDARPETIFPFFTDPAKMVPWKGVHATLDPRPGGIYRVDVTGRDIARGEYVEVVPNSKVVFTWEWEEEGNPVPPGSSTVEISLIPDGDGSIVRMRHFGLTVDQGNAHAEGWEHFLQRLGIVAEGREPGPDPWVTRPG